jgi:methionyl-tRNA formyltransferase
VRVSIIGQAAFGEAAYRRLREDGVEVAAVSAPAPAAGGRPDPLWAAATADGLPCVETRRLREPDGEQSWRSNAAEICVMAFVTDILPPSTFSVARLGTIQYHPSLLPLHRGASAINWAVINGDTETGLTIFWPDDGVDTGPVLLQRSCPIGPDDTVASLYFERLFPMGVEALSEGVRLVGAGTAPRVAQDHALATHEPPCRPEHGVIRWHEPARRLYALIRGCNPQPGASATYRGKPLRIFDCRFSEVPEPGMPGHVLRCDGDGFDVRLNGGVLRVLRVQPERAPKVSAGEWASSVGLAPGSRFR